MASRRASSGRPLSFGWIMQPALFETPPGVDPRAGRLAREMIAANELHVELARSAGFDTVWVEDHMGWGDKAHLECFTNMAWLAGRHPGLRYGTMVCGQAFRNPAYLAKLAVNMQLLTDNNFILGIGRATTGPSITPSAFPSRRPARGWRRPRRRSTSFVPSGPRARPPSMARLTLSTAPTRRRCRNARSRS